MKVLLYCPLYPKSPRIYARSLQSIFTQDFRFPIEMTFGKNDGATVGITDLVDKHNRARQWALDGGYDVLFVVEADNILPYDALSRLAAIDTDVAYGLYCSRHGKHQWLAFSELREKTGRSIDRNRRWCAANWGKVIETKGVGMGCTLIRRRALEAIEFRVNGAMADDWYFSLDCQEKGFSQHHDLGVVCGHVLRDGSNKIVWPSIESATMYEYERPE